MIDEATLLRRIPKVELHCHLEGAIRATTLVELAHRHGIPLPTDDVDQLYAYDDITGFLAVYEVACRAVVTADDFARIAYESLEDGVNLGNLRYREMFFNPTLHPGVPYPTMLVGLLDGIRSAECDLRVQARLIPSIYRQMPVAAAREMLDEVLAHRSDEIVGIGMDGDEIADPPQKFADVYRAAGDAGLRRTAHTSHDGPAAFVTTCLDLLGCDRIDHGYHVIDDPDLVGRVRDAGTPFACASPTPPLCGWPKPLAESPIRAMVDAGITVTLNSDDPTMLHTDIGTEYVKVCAELGYGVERARQFVTDALDAAWLDDADRRTLRAELDAEIDALAAQLVAPEADAPID